MADARRSYTREFKLAAVKLITEQDYSVAEAARRLGVNASEHYRRLLAKHGIECSMSRRADCWDNAPMESFLASLKKELVHHEDYQTREEAKASLFE